ncbi:MAG: metal-dependent hydrolase [Leucobacter sp.]
MMGFNHALCGAAAWTAVAASAPGFPSFGVLHVQPWAVLTGAVVCAGAALLPDADHHSATIARSVPGGRAVAGAAGALSGGHRHGLHSLVAALGVWFLSLWIGQLTCSVSWWEAPIQTGAAVAVAALICLAVKTLRLAGSWPRAWAIGIVVGAALALFLPSGAHWFAWCVTLGYGIHLLGDWLTAQGINWFWPLRIRAPSAVRRAPMLNRMWGRNGYFALPLLGTAGSWRESVLGAALGLYALVGIALSMFAR